MIRAGFGLFLLATLGACAAKGPLFLPVQNVPEGFGVVYVYRQAKHANKFMEPGITVDGREYPALPSGRYLPFLLKEGQHAVGLALGQDWRGSTSTLNVEVAKGTTSYVHLTTYNEDVG